MTAKHNTTTESRLSERICELKKQRAYAELVEFLENTLAREEMSVELQGKAHNELGLAHLQQDNPIMAQLAFERAVECSPGNVNPRFNKANMALYAREYDQALEQYLEILLLNPDHNGARYHAGLCCAMTNRPDAALPYFESSAAADPEAMGPHFWAGETLLHTGEFGRALPYFRRAVEITPTHPESLRGAAICLFELREYHECISYSDVLIVNGKGSELMALGIKGDALLEIGKTEDAALCHLDMAFIDFDARDFIVQRTKRLAEQDRPQLAEYVEVVLAHIPELEPSITAIRLESATIVSARQAETIER